MIAYKQKHQSSSISTLKRSLMKKLLFTGATLAICLSSTIAFSSSYHFQADNVSGIATVSGYANAAGTIINTTPPTWSYNASSGTVDQNLGSFTPGVYTIDFTLDGFWVDFDNDHVHDFTTIIPASITFNNVGPFNIPGIPPLTGSYGPLSWSIASNFGSGTFVYDFGSTGSFTNAGVNAALLGIDHNLGGYPFDKMDTAFGLDHLRIDLNSTSPAPVPEPMSMLLLGSGLVGMATVIRKKKERAEE